MVVTFRRPLLCSAAGMRATTLARICDGRLAHHYHASWKALLWDCYGQVLGPRCYLPKLADCLCRHPDAWIRLHPHFIWQATESYLEGGNAFGLVTTDLAHIMAVLFIVVFVLNGGVSMSHAWHMIGPRLFGNRSKDNRLQKFALVVRDFVRQNPRRAQWLISGQFVVALSYASKQTRKGPLGATRSHCATAIRTSAIHQPLQPYPTPTMDRPGVVAPPAKVCREDRSQNFDFSNRK
jgi:hypothetical protein